MTRFPLASRMVLDYLGDLCRPRAELRAHHMQPLEHFMYRAWVRGHVREWAQRVAAANALIERGFNERTSAFGPLWGELADSPGNLLVDVNRRTSAAWESGAAETPEERFRPLRDLYGSAYEGVYRTEAAVFVAADAVLGDQDPRSFIDEDGKVNAREVERLESRRDLPAGLLTEGLNAHLRNSIFHARYEVLSMHRIRMWDRRPSGGSYTWGPVEFTHSELHETVFAFLGTCEALVAAKIMFDVNNNSVLRARGYLDHRPRRFRIDIARMRLSQKAAILGFECLGVAEADDDTLRVQLRIRGERQEHPERIYAGDASRSAAFEVEVETREMSIRLQMYTLVQHTWQIYETYERVLFEVVDPDHAPLGRVIVDADHLFPLRDMEVSADELRECLPEDTLPDDAMPVVIRHTPKRL